MGVPGHGSREHSGLPGDSSTWAVCCPWTLPLGEASHVHQRFFDDLGLDSGESTLLPDNVVGGFIDDLIGQTTLRRESLDGTIL
jgi:hypothetical protein